MSGPETTFAHQALRASLELNSWGEGHSALIFLGWARPGSVGRAESGQDWPGITALPHGSWIQSYLVGSVKNS